MNEVHDGTNDVHDVTDGVHDGTNNVTELEEVFLNETWNIYFHDPYDTNWTTTSYNFIGQITSINDFWMHHNKLHDHIHQGMFFIMREYVFPMWDAEENIEGGCLSIKVLKENMADFWRDLTIKVLGENLIKPEYIKHWNLLNGISTSPKKHFCIIKIWLKDNTLNNKDFFNLKETYYGDILYKSNRENICGDAAAHAAPAVPLHVPIKT